MTGDMKSAAARANAYNDRVEVEFGVLRHSHGDKQRKSVTGASGGADRGFLSD